MFTWRGSFVIKMVGVCHSLSTGYSDDGPGGRGGREWRYVREKEGGCSALERNPIEAVRGLCVCNLFPNLRFFGPAYV
jgi:hypothetical protein